MNDSLEGNSMYLSVTRFHILIYGCLAIRFPIRKQKKKKKKKKKKPTEISFLCVWYYAI